MAVPAAKVALRDRIDDQLRADLPAVRAAVLAGSYGRAQGPSAGLAGREHAVVLIDRGRVRVLARSGLPGELDAPPDLSRAADSAGTVDYAQATDGTKYRYLAVALDGGRHVAVAAPIDDLAALVDELTRTFALIGIAGGAALALASWWWIRHCTRPIERLTERADAIATGDANRSLYVPARTAELRRLAQALDAMISSDDASLALRRQSEARLREFVANASHELRTPLTSVSGYLQLDLDGALADDEQHQRSMGLALAETARKHRIVADLQLLTETDEDVTPVMVAIDLNALVREALHDSRTRDPSRTWVARLADRSVLVRGDADQLHQVLANLLENIRIHTPAGTVGTITTAVRDGTAVIEVSDDGPGVPADELARVFDRFWRHDVSRTRKSGGSGLGLSVVESHGGAVAATPAVSGGLAIRVELPSAAEVAV